MLKRIVLSTFFLFVYVITYSQGDTAKVIKFDTLVTVENLKIPGRVTEIGEDEIKYKKANNPDGPIYTISKERVRQIIFSNGVKETIKHDELSMAPKPDVINQRRAIKIHPFSPLFNKVTLGYEQVLKMGINLEVKAGYINSNMTKNTGINSYGGTTTTGAFLQGGVKFLLGQEFYMKGMKYMHPLKGRYIRIDAILSDLSIKNPLLVYNNLYLYQQSISTVTANAFGYGLFVNYGRQWILGNILTLDYYVGIGASGSSVNYLNNSNSGNIRYSIENVTNYYGFLRTVDYFSITGGFTLGYIFKESYKKQ